jgi:predicted O-linked N-acetylglucosamine transferase (SPINDLY family)
VSSVTKTINRGVELLHQGKPEEAAALYRRVVALHPKHPDALHLLSVAVYQLGDPVKAVQWAKRAIALAPGAADYHSNLGRYAFSLGNHEEALASLRRALEINPRHAIALMNLSQVLQKTGSREEALDVAYRHAELVPDDALAHHHLGTLLAEMQRPEEAMRSFERVLALRPESPEALNNIGNALQAMGRNREAVVSYERALTSRPGYGEALCNLGTAHQALGDLDQAERCYREALRLQPGFPAARGNIANLLGARRQYEEAVTLYRELLAENPEWAETWNNLGNSLQELGRYGEAERAYYRALEINPYYYLVHNNLGNTSRRQGRYEEAVAHYKKAIAANSQFVEAINNLGVVLQDMNRSEESVARYQEAITIRPDYVDPWINLGNHYRDHARPEEAIRYIRRALEINPANPFVWNNLGCALGDQGLVAEGIDCYRAALARMPDNAHAFSNVLLNIHYLDSYTPEQIYAEHLEFGRRFGGRAAAFQAPHANVPDPERPLRIGYVSADYRRHSVAFFLEPLIERHDREQFTVLCYADVQRPDAWTRRFEELAGDGWRDIRGFNDQHFAEQVRADGVDILIDTGAHTANSRLISFTARPAPVQVTYLGYPNTTGLDSIDYRLTDAFCDPEGQAERLHTEQLVRLRGGFLCFRPPASSPGVAPQPSAAGNPFTFGSFNNMSKVSQATIRMWSEILRRVPGSRLALKNKALSEPEARGRVIEAFAREGIAPERIWMSGLIASLSGHLEAYNLVDLALDTYPYHGTTTTCESFWMGVPVVTLIGRAHVSRVGGSLLGAVGLGHLAVGSAEEYIGQAVALSGQRQLLAEWRVSLRGRISQSALMDEAGFLRRLEGAYRLMWRNWCQNRSMA